MKTNLFSTSTTGWVALATGATVILAVLFLALMAAAGMFFGAVNDVLNSVFGIASAVLAWMFHAEHRATSPGLSQIALALAILGAFFGIAGSVLVQAGITGFVLAGLVSGLANAWIGTWLMMFCSSMLRSDVLPHNLVRFGRVVGAFMMLGLIGIPGILAGVDDMVFMPSYLYLAFFGWIGTYVLYPIWTIWLGRTLLSQ